MAERSSSSLIVLGSEQSLMHFTISAGGAENKGWQEHMTTYKYCHMGRQSFCEAIFAPATNDLIFQLQWPDQLSPYRQMLRTRSRHQQ
ncbi:MAG: hypothetical protein Ct9H300mP13_2590 [Gammaproteobacteria bacterium]|nr:MAG: hypothetical protein Ct9H300mP13_2590 [Gammaproteobacteria bacterium]